MSLIASMDLLFILLSLLITLCLGRDISETNFRKSSKSENLLPCEKDWYEYGNYCYAIYGTMSQGESYKKPWIEAVQSCQELDGNLASIHSFEENEFLEYLLTKELRVFTWIGLQDRIEESQFSWQDGSKLDFENWALGEPSGDEHGDEDCVGLSFEPTLNRIGNWNDATCENSHAYICKKSSNLDGTENDVLCENQEVHLVEHDNGEMYYDGCNKFDVDVEKAHSCRIIGGKDFDKQNPVESSGEINNHYQVASYKNLTSLLKSSEKISVGTLVFVTDDQTLLVRVKKGWKYIQMQKLIHAPTPVEMGDDSRMGSELPIKMNKNPNEVTGSNNMKIESVEENLTVTKGTTINKLEVKFTQSEDDYEEYSGDLDSKIVSKIDFEIEDFEGHEGA